jgi:hypothetical protein
MNKVLVCQLKTDYKMWSVVSITVKLQLRLLRIERLHILQGWRFEDYRKKEIKILFLSRQNYFLRLLSLSSG